MLVPVLRNRICLTRLEFSKSPDSAPDPRKEVLICIWQNDSIGFSDPDPSPCCPCELVFITAHK